MTGTLTVLLSLLILLLVLLVLLPGVVLLTEVCAAMKRPKAVSPLPVEAVSPPPGREAQGAGVAAPRPSLAVLVPAHDESGALLPTLQSVAAQLRPGDRLVVIADNCGDDTAVWGRRGGAEVIERQDPTRRGKGYALDFGLRHLQAAPPELVVCIDADCWLGDGALDRLAAACVAHRRPAQGRYMIWRPPEADSLGARIAEFALIVKNLVRPTGLRRLGGPCPLHGSGMMFPWPLIIRAELASGHIVEDMKLGVDLTLMGHSPVFVPEAAIDSRLPVGDAARRTQHERWEHGHLQTLRWVPALLARAARRLDASSLGMALDLMVPPVVMLGGLQVVVALLVSVLAALGVVGAWLAALAWGALACTTLALVLARAGFAADILPWSALRGAPEFLLGKLPLYLRFVTRRHSGWVRSQRDHER